MARARRTRRCRARWRAAASSRPDLLERFGLPRRRPAAGVPNHERRGADQHHWSAPRRSWLMPATNSSFNRDALPNSWVSHSNRRLRSLQPDPAAADAARKLCAQALEPAREPLVPDHLRQIVQDADDHRRLVGPLRGSFRDPGILAGCKFESLPVDPCQGPGRPRRRHFATLGRSGTGGSTVPVQCRRHEAAGAGGARASGRGARCPAACIEARGAPA